MFPLVVLAAGGSKYKSVHQGGHNGSASLPTSLASTSVYTDKCQWKEKYKCEDKDKDKYKCKYKYKYTDKYQCKEKYKYKYQFKMNTMGFQETCILKCLSQEIESKCKTTGWHFLLLFGLRTEFTFSWNTCFSISTWVSFLASLNRSQPVTAGHCGHVFTQSRFPFSPRPLSQAPFTQF